MVRLPRLAVLTCSLLSLNPGQGAEVDATEFGEVADARAFGWGVTDQTELTVTREAKVGQVALCARPRAGAGPYRGFNLIHEVDLTGAGPGDTIVFHVKQNFGSGMRIQLWTNQGPFNRSFKAAYQDWSRIELDLDPSQWENPKQQPWGRVNRIQFYERQFQTPEQYLILDGLSITVGGKAVLMQEPAHALTTWTFPHQNQAAWYLGNEQAAWAISKATGQVLGGWNAKTRERYLNRLEGRYHVEDRQALVTGRESRDTVQRARLAEQEQRLELVCANPDLPGLAIAKRYQIDGDKLYQRLAFRDAGRAPRFITYNSQASFTLDYRNGGYYMGGADGGGPLVPAPAISTWQRVTQYQSTAKGMVLHQPERGYGFAQVRTRLDDQFVWPWFTGAIASYVEAPNMLSYTPDGWDMSLGTSKLAADKETSCTQFLSIFAGDWQRFLRSEYPALPEVQQALSEIPPTPEWVGDIKIATGDDPLRLKRIVEMTDEGTIMVLVNLSGSWADYYVDRGMYGGYGGWIEGPELRDYIRRIKALSPRIKVGIYMWVLSTTDRSRIYAAHPEWFRYGNKDGEPLTTFPGMWRNFAHLFSAPGCADELLSQFDLVLDYLGTDFIYLDDPKAVNLIDWKTGEYTRDDMSFRFFRDLKRRVARHGPDKMLFFNNRGNPYGDINYIEARDQLRANYWRHFVGIAAVTEEFVSATRPKARIIPLYFIPPTRREYMNRVLALGWIPDLTYCDVIGSRPFFQAAYEVGRCASAVARYSPDWKRDKATDIESFAVRRDDDRGVLLSFINHAETRSEVPVRIELDSLDLDRTGQVFVWEYEVANALEYLGFATEGLARQVYGETGWQLDRVTRRRLRYAGPYRPELEVPLGLEPLALRQLYLTGEPAAVYSEHRLPANYLFGHTPRVSLTSRAEWAKGAVEVQVDSRRDDAEVVLLLPAGRSLGGAALDGRPIAAEWVWEGDAALPVVKVGRGKHTLAVTLGPTVTAPAVDGFAAEVSPTGATLRVPGYDRALVTVEGDGRASFNRVVAGEAGLLKLPLSPARPAAGSYTVTLRAVFGPDGRPRPITPVTATIALPAAPPDQVLSPDKPVKEPGQRELTEVNRTVRGVAILRAAAVTTPTTANDMQPGLKLLTAAARPDELVLEAGTTRAIMQGQDGLLGAAFAGFEIKDVRRVRVRLGNTFHDAFHLRGPGFHVPERPNSRNFAGMVVDYHTPKGYTKRVRLAIGVLHPSCSSTQPDYGQAALADVSRDLGAAVIEAPERTFAVDLQPDAPADWDGQVWLSVGSDWIAPNRRLRLQILAVNEAVSGEFLTGTDPRAFREAYLQPRTLEVPRSPGGIVIDGLPHEEMWGGAAVTEQFYLYGGEGVSKAKTTAKLLYDDEQLLLAFVCAEPDRRKPLIVGGPPWDDDEIEVWIDANGDLKTFRQVIVNAANEKLEYSESGPTPIGAVSAVHVVEGQTWMVELTIPFAGLGVKPPRPGDTWRLSLCRGRPPGKNVPNHELIVWAPLKQGGFKDLASFGTLTFR